MPFSLRVRLGQCEVEISGSREDVLRTVEDLSNLVSVVSDVFAEAGAKLGNAASVGSASSPPVSGVYPSVQSSGGCGDAVLKLLSTDWGKGTPRTLPELVDALRANALRYPATTLSGVLNWLVRKGELRRWKTDKGYVYVLAGETGSASSDGV